MNVMRINLYIKELAGYRKSVFFWLLGMLGLLLSGMSKYQGYAKSKVSVTELFDSLPPGLSAIFGVGKVDLSSAGGFYAIMALYVAIMLAVHAVLLGSGIIAKEEVDKTAEFLFSKPISRWQAFISKVLAAFSIVVFLNILTTLASIPIVDMFNEGPSINDDILLLAPAIFFIQLIFLTIGISFASIMKRPKRAGRFSAALLLATFIISSFVDISDKFDFLRYFTPFQYFDVKTIFADRGYNTSYIVAAIVFVLSFLLISGVAFRKRDFNV